MDTEILNATHEGMFPSQLMMIEAIALITIIFAIAGVAICLAGIAWLCFDESRRPVEYMRHELVSSASAQIFDLPD